MLALKVTLEKSCYCWVSLKCGIEPILRIGFFYSGTTLLHECIDPIGNSLKWMTQDIQ